MGLGFGAYPPEPADDAIQWPNSGEVGEDDDEFEGELDDEYELDPALANMPPVQAQQEARRQDLMHQRAVGKMAEADAHREARRVIKSAGKAVGMANVDVDAVKEEVIGSLAALETVMRGQGHDEAFIREFIAENDMAGRLVSGSIEKQKNDAVKNRALKRV